MRWILLRGLTREAGHWGELPAQLSARAGEPVTALDLPGNGRRNSERSLATVHATARDCCRRTAAGEPVLLVAMSLGAMVALEWARIAPQAVAGCVLINTSAGGASRPWDRLRPRNYATMLRLLLPGQPLAEREHRVLEMTSARPHLQAGRAEHWARLAATHPVTPANALRQLWAAARYRAPRRRPPVPLLLLSSACDGLVSPRCSQALASQWNVPLRMHPWAGHDLPLDDPDWLVQALCEWRHTLAR